MACLFTAARRAVVLLLLAALLGGATARPAQGQQIAKYGADFLAGGVGARAIGLGGAYVGLADDVTAGYWNPAGFAQMPYPEIGYMHVERFGGVVSFDYGGAAFPVGRQSTVGLTVIRSGVNDIVNTLNAYQLVDGGGGEPVGQPVPNYPSSITRFSAADYLVSFSYAHVLGEHLSVGGSGKVSRRSIGEFADSWGYSADLGVQYRTGLWGEENNFTLGLQLQDAFPYIQSWSVNPNAFQIDNFEKKCRYGANDENIFSECLDADGNVIDDNAARFDSLFSQEIPEGQTELVTPTARLGSGLIVPVDEQGSSVTVGAGGDVRFDGRRAFLLNVGDVSFEPRLGAEFDYRNVVAVRGGINRVQHSDRLGLDLTPSVGAGLNLAQFSINYAFGDFGGASSELGYSHRISAQLRLEQPGLARSDDEE
ncbi:MAG: hypothetical protein BRD40_03285 [Bacteroidetes bacterium QS_1_65_9]|nr:MAG: hypothetical protein BRD40_03285 [Bacteroidetes bacterium QS_1_65_9]